MKRRKRRASRSSSPARGGRSQHQLSNNGILIAIWLMRRKAAIGICDQRATVERNEIKFYDPPVPIWRPAS